MNNFDLLKKTRQYAEEYIVYSWWVTLSSFGILAGIVVCQLWVENALAKIAMSLLSGLLILRLFILFHDYTHGAILRNSKLAYPLFKMFGWIVLTPTSVWKRSHDFHHHYNSKMATANIGSYPVVSVEGFQKLTSFEQRMYLFLRSPLCIFMGYFTVFMWGMCIQPFFNKKQQSQECIYALLFHACMYAVSWWFLGALNTLTIVFLPLFWSSMIGAYLFYVQHNFPGVVYIPAEDWHYTDAALESTCYIKMNRLMRWFSGNIGYHHIHHLNHKIPFYRLPEAMQKLPIDHSIVEVRLSLATIIKSFQLQVWDVEKNQMVSVKEAYASLSQPKVAL